MSGLEPFIAAAASAAASTAPTVGTVLSGVGAVTGLVGGIRQANAIKAQGRAIQEQRAYEAEQQRVAAGQERAAAQHAAAEEARVGRLRASQIQATAAAQGQSGNESIMDILGNLDAETQYRKSLELFEGDKRSQQLEHGASLSEFQGQQEYSAAKTRATSTRVGAFSDFATSIGGTLYNKYAPKKSQYSTRENITWINS